MAVASPPRLLYHTEVRRGTYARRWLRMLLGAVACLAAGLALHEAVRRGLADPLLLDVGLLLAIVLGAWFAVRAVANFVRLLTRRAVIVRIYNKGVMWQEGERISYRWGQIMRFREGARGWYLFGRPILQWGAHTLSMDDRRVLRFTAAYGDPRAFAKVVRPYAAHVTSIRMGRVLRDDKPVRLNRRLIIYPGGVEASGKEIHWSELDAVVRGRRLIIRRALPNGRWRTAGRYRLETLDNVGGFIEIVRGQLPQYQPERYRQQQPASAAR